MNIVLLSVLILLQVVMIGVGIYLAILLRSIIVPVFSTDPDTSLRSILHSLDTAAKLAANVGKNLEVNIAEARQQFSRLVVILDHLQTGVDIGTAVSERMETETHEVAKRLSESQQTARGIDPNSPAGTAADSAASGPSEKV